jgi:hypothetical protein
MPHGYDGLEMTGTIDLGSAFGTNGMNIDHPGSFYTP